MMIHYENEMDDLISFNEHYAAHSPMMRRSMTQVRWVISGVVFVGTFGGIIAVTSLIYNSPKYAVAAIVSAICTLSWYVTCPQNLRHGMKKSVSKMYEDV